MLRLRGVRKTYRGAGEVLAGIDLEVRAGTPCVVSGGNGTGKSTLLRIVAGAAAPSAGTVTGRPPVVGFVPGRVPASERLPVRGYVRRLAAVHGARRRAGEAFGLLEELGFTGELDAPVGNLSSGNVQKVALAQALGCGAGLVVLDEPWSALDADARDALDAVLRRIENSAMVVVADHGGRSGELPGAQRWALGAGVLGMAPARAAADVIIELAVPPGHHEAALRDLQPVAGAWPVGSALAVRVGADGNDALLVAAIARGWSVLAVRREAV